MALTKNLYRRITLLTVIVVAIQLIYVAVGKGFKIDPDLMKGLGVFFTFIVVMLITTVVLRFTANKVWTMFEKEMEVEQRIIISKLYSISLYSLAFIISFWRAGLSINNITIFAGLIATGFAFAVRDVLLSFFAWFIILNKKPFHMGDYIRIGEEQGLVTRIGTFFFTLELENPDEYIKVPNSHVMTKSIYNRGTGRFRDELKFPLKSVPEDFKVRLTELSTYIKTRNTFKEGIRANLTADNGGWYIQVEFLNSYKQDQLRWAVFAETQRLFAENLKLSSSTL